MKILKTKKLFTYMVVGALVMALSISCKSNEEPSSDTGWTHQQHPVQGTYTASAGSIIPNANATVRINNDGTCTITGTAYFDANDSQTFSITITKWHQYYNDSVARAGINGYGTEKSEVTINSPTTDYFAVEYDGRLGIAFGPEGKRYTTGYLTKQ